MDTYDKLYDMLEKELDEIVKKGALTADSLMSLDKIVDVMKDINEICDHDEDSGYSQRGYVYTNGGNSYRRSGNSYRDGRYSRGGANRGNSYRGYSRRDEREEILNHLDYLMETSGTEKERQAIKDALNALENM